MTREALSHFELLRVFRSGVYFHGLRHTHASELRAEGVDIGIISKQLGHRSIATTARYLDHIAPQQVIETMRTRVWQS